MDDVITLIKDNEITHDEYGNEIITQTERDLFCQVFGVTRSEFYSAATANMHPELTVRLSEAADYEGETLARYNGVLYSIIRTYRDRASMGSAREGNYDRMGVNAIELILERKIGDG